MVTSTVYRHLRTFPTRMRNWTPSPVLETDVFLVSFPKSGNTWMRFMLANSIVRQAKLETQVTFRTVHQIIRDVHVDRIGLDAAFPPFPRIIKSHAAYNSAYPRVIYIVRDGRDVTISNHAALKRNKAISPEAALADLFRDQRLGVVSWRNHAAGWLNAGLGERLLLLRYEDLMADPAKGLAECVRFCGVEPQNEIIEQAVQASSFVNMREIEERDGLYIGKTEPGARFVRKGQPGEWKEVFSPEELRYFSAQAGTVLQQLGYPVEATQ